MASLLRNNIIEITPKISIKAVSVGEILDYGEKDYYNLLTAFMATPFEMMAPLFLSGVDYESIDDYELFIRNFAGLKKEKIDVSILLNGIQTDDLLFAKSRATGEMTLYGKENGIVIDRAAHTLIAMNVRKMLFSTPPQQEAGNQEAKEYMLERAVKKYKRQAKKEYKPFLEKSVIALVNTEQFKYDYEGAMKLNIYAFNASARQILRKTNYDNIMRGVYSGTINLKEINLDEIDWFSCE